MKYIFGPVKSRRLGLSLGVDIIPYKTCSFNCIYCECGHTTNKTMERKAWVNSDDVLDEISTFLKTYSKKIDYITFSGSGEPTLHSDLGKIIERIKKITDIPVAVLTNSSLMHLPEVRESLNKADLVVPSLDAVSDTVFKKIDRPLDGISVEQIVDSLVLFKRSYKGQMWLEILFVEGLNTEKEEIEKLKEVIKKIKPDRVQLNTVDRTPLYEWVKPVSFEKLLEISKILDFPYTDIVSSREPLKERQGKEHPSSFEREEIILNLIKESPLSTEEISERLNMGINSVERTLHGLITKKKIKRIEINGKVIYELNIY